MWDVKTGIDLNSFCLIRLSQINLNEIKVANLQSRITILLKVQNPHKLSLSQTVIKIHPLTYKNALSPTKMEKSQINLLNLTILISYKKLTLSKPSQT